MITGAGGLEEKYAKEMNMKANQLQSRALIGKDVPQEGGGDVATSFHMRNWMDCVRSRKNPNADIEAGYSHSIALCMTVAAIQTGQRVTFDDAKQDVVTGGAA
jgi:hypothetical protein